MKLFCKVSVSENCQKNLMTYVFVGHIVVFMFGLILSTSAFCIKISLGSRISFLAHYYGTTTVPAVLFLTGVFLIIKSIMAVLLCFEIFDAKSESTRLQSVNKTYFLYFLASSAALYGAITTILVFVYELQILHLALKRGILEAMKSYSLDIKVKEELDVLQMKHGCCGLESYEDWFYVKWMDEKYLEDFRREEIKKGEKYFLDDVPYSCCDRTVMHPCINERVLDEKAYHGYDYKISLTLYKGGCLQALWHLYGKQTFMKIAGVLLIVSCFQISLAISTRLLQTSMQSSWNGDEPTTGWILSLNCEDSGTIVAKDSDENFC